MSNTDGFWRKKFGEGPDQRIDDQFGEWLKNERIKYGLSAGEAAGFAQMSRARWMAIERGAVRQAVNKKEIWMISKVLDLPEEVIRKKAAGEE